MFAFGDLLTLVLSLSLTTIHLETVLVLILFVLSWQAVVDGSNNLRSSTHVGCQEGVAGFLLQFSLALAITGILEAYQLSEDVFLCVILSNE